MWFVDQAHILTAAGAGGNGCSAMVRRPYNRYARAAGGNGGDGGEVMVIADPQLTTLLDFQFRGEFRAGRGGHGGNHGKTGKRGAVCVIPVPVGTMIFDAEEGSLLRDLAEPEQPLVVARGGRGGKGNLSAPEAMPGQPGERRALRLELKLIADVGLVGFPNAGKSSLLARLSTARPKVAPYPFTTQTPVLGVVSVGQAARDRGASARHVYGTFVACDIPGLIEGAHSGRGMGFQFLRHVERTRLLLHVIDMAGTDGRDPVKDFANLKGELLAYHAALQTRPQVVVANKMDLPQAAEHLARLRASVQEPIVPISCATGAGIPELIRTVWEALQRSPVPDVEVTTS